MKNIHCFILSCLILLFNAVAIQPIQASAGYNSISFANSDWMEELGDQLPLTRISIPGTHDSGTYELRDPIKAVWGKTQKLNFKEQLHNGIRFFDIRGRATSDTQIVLHHGPIYLYLTLHQFLNEAERFLKEHPSETIIMSFKEEYERMNGVKKSFRRIFKDTYFNQRSSFYKGTAKNPTLGETRGKIVLFDRTGGSDLPGYTGISWPDNQSFERKINNGNLILFVQDQYDVSYSTKEKAIKNHLIKTNNYRKFDHTLFVNFISLSSGGTAWSSPYYYASYLNELTAKSLGYWRSGWVVMDYVGDKWDADLALKVIATNSSLY